MPPSSDSDPSQDEHLPQTLFFRVAEGVPMVIDMEKKIFLRVPECTSKLFDPSLEDPRKNNVCLELISKSLSNYGISISERNHSWPQPDETSPHPNAIRIEVTNKCNMRCRYCFNSSGLASFSTLSSAHILQAIDDFVDLGGRIIIFSGGEPLMHPEIIRILSHASSTVQRTCLATNGLLLKGDLLRSLSSLPIHLTISLDGLSPETHEANRGESSFNIIYNNLIDIANIPERLCEIGIAMTVTATNYDDMKPMIDFAKDMNLDYLAICLPKYQGRARDFWKSICLTEDQQIDLHEYVTEQCNACQGLINIEGGHYNQVNAFFFNKDMPKFNCRPGESLKITPDGRIFACPQTEASDFEIGHISDGGLKIALEGDRLKNIRHRVRERLNHLVECQSCDWMYLCQGGCPCDALDNYADLNQPDSFCQPRKKIFERTLNRLARTARANE